MKGTMKRTAVTLGVAAVMGVFASNAAASGQSGGQADALKIARKAAASAAFFTASDGHGGAKYRLGDKGLWMQ